MNDSFLVLTDDQKQTRLIAVGIIIVILAVAVFFITRGGIGNLVPDMSELQPISLLYMGFAAGLFFFGLPLEVILFRAVQSGSAPVASIAAILGGFVLGNLVSYVIGLKLSRIALSLVSAKKIYGMRRKVNQRGKLYVYAANTIPFLPAPVLTFALGIARYNMIRLFIFLVLGALTKFSVSAYLATVLA